MPNANPIRVFYSWQSDLPKKTNRDAIDAALKIAGTKINTAFPAVQVTLDEATRDTPGSPNIVSNILEKIKDADVVVADITTTTSPDVKRPCPNPNVVYELGYAVALLGWERVILLFNEEFGTFPDDLPFDFAQHRTRPYRLAEAGPKSARGDLTNLLEEAIISIVEKNPQRPAETRELPRGKIEHDRDVENMKSLISTIHLPTLEDCIDHLPYKITDRALFSWDSFSGVAFSSLFSVYDPVLKVNIDKLSNNWRTALSHDNEYGPATGAGVHFFSNPLDLPLPTIRQQAWDDIQNASIKMREALDAILGRLRESYIEIDINKMSEQAWETYIASENTMFNVSTRLEF